MQFGEIVFAQTEDNAVILTRKIEIAKSVVARLLPIHFLEHVFG